MPTPVSRTPLAKPARPGPTRPAPAPTARGVAPLALPKPSRSGPPAVVLTPSAAASPDPGASREIADLVRTAGPGSPLPPPVKESLEASLKVSLDSVRVHTDAKTAAVVSRAGSRAFTFGPNVYLGPRERATDLTLMAHEVAHVVQQQGAPVVQHAGTAAADSFESEARRISAAVGRGEGATVRERTSRPRVQHLGIGDALDFFADKANLIPGFRMFTIILGVNPINMSSVDRSAANILRALVEFLPGGGLIVMALDKYGVFDKAGAWVEEQIRSLGITGGLIKQAISDFLDSLGWSDIFDLGGVWNRAKRIFTEPIDRLISFGKGLVDGIITMVKDAILMPIAELASKTRGWDLLTAILGKNPITGEAVPRTAETLIGGFMKLIGQEDVWQNMKNANAIGRAWAWFQGAMATLIALVSGFPANVINAFKSLEISDIVVLPRALSKIAAVFGNFIGDFISWAGTSVWNLLEIVFDVVSPGALAYIKKTGSALKIIFKNPLPFVGNLVKAAKLGFNNFKDNFGGHLKAGLIDWLTGSLPGIYIPKAFTLGEVAKFAFSVLGLTWANIRQKLVKVVGEPAVAAMEAGFDIVVTLVREGPSAAWDKLQTQLTNLKDMVIGGITDFVVDMVVKKAIPKLVAMFIPGAGFISAILSIYDTVMVFVRKISKIIQVVTGFIDSITAIAAGAIGAAASRVESTLAGLLSLAINFLAGFAGLGKVADKIMEVFNKVRAPIDKALDWLIGWIVTMAKKLFAKAFGKKDKDGKVDERTDAQKQADLNSAVADAEGFLADNKSDPLQVQKKLPTLKSKYKLTSLDLVKDSESKEKDVYHVHGKINPERDSKKVDKDKGDGEKPFKVDSFTKRPSFRPSTKEAIPIVRGEEDRRHITAWQTMHERLKMSLNGKTVKYGADVLERLKHPAAALTVEAVKEAGKAYLLDQFNDDKNLWAGPARDNQDKGRKFAVAKQMVDKAIVNADRALFDANIVILESLWHDPDPSGEKEGFRNLVGMTVRLLRKAFRERIEQK